MTETYNNTDEINGKPLKPGIWDNITTVRVFAKSRFYVCFLCSLSGLYFLLANINISFSLTGAENELNILGGILFLMFLAFIFSGCGYVSVIIGFIFFAAGIISAFIFIYNESFFIDVGIISSAVTYFGLFLMINYDIKSFKLIPTILTFFISRLFLGYCFVIYGLGKLSDFLVSVEIFINFTQNPDNTFVFILGTSCVLTGIFLIASNREISTKIMCVVLLSFSVIMIAQLPAIILYFINRDMIGVYYSNFAFSWQIIVMVLVCVVAGAILAITIRIDKTGKFKSPLPISVKENIIIFLSAAILIFAASFIPDAPNYYPIYFYNIFDGTSKQFTQLADESYNNLYTRLDTGGEYIKIPTLKRKDELYIKAVNYYNQGKYLAALSIFQSKNNIAEKENYINKIETILYQLEKEDVYHEENTDSIPDNTYINGSINSEPTTNERGNTVGNIINQGIVARQGDWIYYHNDGDNGNLYKIRADGSGKMRLNEDDSWDINVLGEWVYYHNDSDGEKLYKIRIDGTDRMELNDERSWGVNVVDEWIYYRTNNDNNDNHKLYKIRTDRTDKTKISDDAGWNLNVVDEWVYYRNNSDGNKLYKIRTDGDRSSITELNDHASWYINVIDEWIYYCNVSDGGKLYKIRTDGSSITKLNDDASRDINVIDEWIFYSNLSDDGKIYKISTNGTQKQIVN